MVILYFADIFGKSGRRAVRAALPDLIARYCPDFIVGNAENLAGGRGVNKKSFTEMIGLGFHAFTSGNHIWDNKDVYEILERDNRLLRPLNYPSAVEPCPGKGYGLFKSGKHELFLVNVMGRVFMDNLDCPFAAVDMALKMAPPNVPILVDMHADATSEKYAMGWHLDGRATAVVGSHSHVQTADERLLTKGTAYITDVGMSGAFDSVIGLEPAEIIKKFMTKRPQSTQAAKGGLGVSCVVIKTGMHAKALSIERLRFSVQESGLEERDSNDDS